MSYQVREPQKTREQYLSIISQGNQSERTKAIGDADYYYNLSGRSGGKFNGLYYMLAGAGNTPELLQERFVNPLEKQMADEKKKSQPQPPKNKQPIPATAQQKAYIRKPALFGQTVFGTKSLLGR